MPEVFAGRRLDQVAHLLFPEFSRTQIQHWINSGVLQLNQQAVKKNRQKLAGNEIIQLETCLQPKEQWQAERIPLHIVYEDTEMMLINKQDQLVMHPAAGNHQGTLLNGLLHDYPTLATLPRAGIIHRLDKNTTGLVVVAKTLTAHTWLVTQMQQRLITREYEALVHGHLISGGTINQPLSRDPHHRLKFCCSPKGKPAITHYRVIGHYPGVTHLRIKLETGRTHQIRVHCAAHGFPIVGDLLYGGRKYTGRVSASIRTALIQFPRQALHAKKLALHHPKTQEYMAWEINMPQDISKLMQILAAR